MTRRTSFGDFRDEAGYLLRPEDVPDMSETERLSENASRMAEYTHYLATGRRGVHRADRPWWKRWWSR
jgi:hypothetical protein